MATKAWRRCWAQCWVQCWTRCWAWTAIFAAAVGFIIAWPPAGTKAQVPASERPTVERLLGEGWEVAGYVAVLENRTLILLKHKEHRYLVQCSVLIDIMRNPRVLTACYEIR